MRTQAAILWNVGEPWSVEDIELDRPEEHEVLVEMGAAGMCHTDDHYATGDMTHPLPMIGGHEGAGTVVSTGRGVSRVRMGDRVVVNFMPICGRCPSCACGCSRLCERGALIGTGLQIADGTSRHHARGHDLHILCCIGTFARHLIVHQDSCLTIDDDIPLEIACLLSCGVPTGWGSAVYTGNVRPGDTVAVVGVGGLGANAVQGARLAGAHKIIGIDPVAFKRTMAHEFGATHTSTSMTDARSLVVDLTRARMCDVVIMTIGIGDGSLLIDALALTAKSGSVVVTSGHPVREMTANLRLLDLTVMEKRVLGSNFGSASFRSDVPKLIDLYRAGQLELHRLVTATYPLEEINEGYADLHAGRNLRGVLTM